MLSKDEIIKHTLRLAGYELFLAYEQQTENLPMCAHCHYKMTLEFIEFLRKWELISEALYNKLKPICEASLEGETCEKE